MFKSFETGVAVGGRRTARVWVEIRGVFEGFPGDETADELAEAGG